MTYLEVNVKSVVPVYQQIMDQLRMYVSEGVLAPGAPLPSVRQLAAELAVNPNTVAKAYQFLELEGTIVTRRRRGAFVGQTSSAKAALARDRRLGEVVDRLVEEARQLGLKPEDILRAVAEKSERDEAAAATPNGQERSNERERDSSAPLDVGDKHRKAAEGGEFHDDGLDTAGGGKQTSDKGGDQ